MLNLGMSTFPLCLWLGLWLGPGLAGMPPPLQRDTTTVRMSTGVHSRPLQKIVAEVTETLTIDVPLMEIPRALIQQKLSMVSDYFIRSGDLEARDYAQHWNDTAAQILDFVLMDRSALGTTSKAKRGVAALGSFFSWCCDVATEQELAPYHGDLQNLQSTMRDLHSGQSTLESNLVHTVDAFQNFSVDMDAKYSQLQYDFVKLQQTIENARRIEFKNARYLAAADGLTLLLVNMLAQESRLHTILHECRRQRLSHALLDPSVLQEKIAIFLNQTSHRNWELATNDVGLLYEQDLASCRLFPTSIKIWLKIPLLSKGSSWSISKYTPIPFAWNGHICRLLGSHRDIMVAIGDEVVVPLFGKEKDFCDQNPICQVPRIDSSFVGEGACIKSLHSAKVVAESIRHCPFQCQNSTDTELLRLTPTEFVVASRLAGSFILQCGRSAVEHAFPGYGAFRIFVPGECTLSINGVLAIRPRSLIPRGLTTQEKGAEFIVPAAWSTRLQIEIDSIRNIDDSPKFRDDPALINASWMSHTPAFFPLSPLPSVIFQNLSSVPTKPYHLFPGEDLAVLIALAVGFVLILLNFVMLAFLYLSWRPSAPSSTPPTINKQYHIQSPASLAEGQPLTALSPYTEIPETTAPPPLPRRDRLEHALRRGLPAPPTPDRTIALLNN